jgi:hypothetical protein
LKKNYGGGLCRSRFLQWSHVNFFLVKGEGLRSMKIEIVPDEYSSAFFWSVIDENGKYVDGNKESSYGEACEEALDSLNVFKIAQKITDNPDRVDEILASIGEDD